MRTIADSPISGSPNGSAYDRYEATTACLLHVHRADRLFSAERKIHFYAMNHVCENTKILLNADDTATPMNEKVNDFQNISITLQFLFLENTLSNIFLTLFKK